MLRSMLSSNSLVSIWGFHDKSIQKYTKVYKSILNLKLAKWKLNGLRFQVLILGPVPYTDYLFLCLLLLNISKLHTYATLIYSEEANIGRDSLYMGQVPELKLEISNHLISIWQVLGWVYFCILLYTFVYFCRETLILKPNCLTTTYFSA